VIGQSSRRGGVTHSRGAREGTLALAAIAVLSLTILGACTSHRAGFATGTGAVAPAIPAVPVAASAAPSATPTPTPPNPLGPGLGLASDAPGPSPIVNYPPLMAPPLWLQGPQGRLFDFAYTKGTPILLYFGYTHCPDVCPASLGVIREAVAKAGVPVQVVFVTVDPARDTRDVLDEYLSYFGQGWIGLTGTEGEIHRATDEYGARYQKIETGSANGYAVGHTTEIYLIDKNGNWIETFPFGTNSQQIVDELRKLSTF
jgi:protein SCO1